MAHSIDQKLVENPLIKRWLRLKKSSVTRYSYAIKINLFLKHFNMTPEELLKMTPKEARELLLTYQNAATKKNGELLSNNAIRSRQTAVVSFLDYHDKPINWKRNTRVKPRPDVSSHVFSNGDLSRMFQVANTRDKCLLSLACSLGWEIGGFVDLKKETLSRLLERQEETSDEFVYFQEIRNKTGQPRLGVLNPLAIKWSREWLKESENMEYKNEVGKPRSHYSKLRVSDIFDLTGRGILYRIKVLARRSGIKTIGNVRFHNIRKWVMSGLSRSGFNEFQIKYVLGKAIPLADATYLQTLEQEIKDRYPRAYEEYLNLETAVPRKALTTVSKDLENKTTEIEQMKQQMKELQTLKENEKKKDARIKELESQLAYLKSPKFTKHLISEIETSSTFKIPDKKPIKTHKVKVKLEDGKKLAELMRKGYSPIYSDDEIWVLEKEIEE